MTEVEIDRFAVNFLVGLVENITATEECWSHVDQESECACVGRLEGQFCAPVPFDHLFAHFTNCSVSVEYYALFQSAIQIRIRVRDPYYK